MTFLRVGIDIFWNCTMFIMRSVGEGAYWGKMYTKGEKGVVMVTEIYTVQFPYSVQCK